MKKKNLITIILVLAILIIGGAAVYLGLKISEPVDELPQTGYPTYDNVQYNFYCPGGTITKYDDSTKGTVCFTITKPSNISWISKHWCNSTTWMNEGCNCPLSSNCAAAHKMADGSIYQQGLYSPTSAGCKCTNGDPNGPSCTSANANDSCKINLFNVSSNFPQTICLDRVKGDWSKTFCGLQQIDVQTKDSSKCFLSGLMANVPECQGPPPVTTKPPTTVPVTTAPPTTVPPTTVPPRTTIPVTTVPPTTIPETTVPPTTTEPPITTMVPPTTKIPDTALISDEVDRMIVGIGLFIVGIITIAFNYHIKLGNLLWKFSPLKSTKEKRSEFEDKF